MKRGVLIGVPSYSGTLSVKLLAFLESALRISADASTPWLFRFTCVSGARPVEYARNALCGDFLRDSAMDRLWFLDADMEPTLDAFELLDLEGDIVGGRALIYDARGKDRPARVRVSAFTHNPEAEKFESAIPAKGERVAEVDAVGTATMLISRRVLEDPRMRIGDEYTDLDGSDKSCDSDATAETWAPAIFRTIYKPNGEILRGEDLDFCLRAKNLGYSIRCDFGIGISHRKNVDLEHIAEMCHYEIALRRKEACVA